ncbi:ABC transporter ATP-binding protein [Aerococcaceae bacterium DSM 111021]|nr:ABC transporter ATP-binding protein [Aerococcaceae bacterium DSM 111021]
MLKKFFSYYTPYKKLFIIDFFCAVLSAILELFFPIAVNMVIDQILPQGNLRHIVMFSVLLLALYLFNTTMNYIVVSIGHLFGSYIETDMRRELFGHFQKQSYAYFDKMKTGDLMSRITTDLFEISELAHHGPEDVFITIMTLVGAFLLMLNVHVPLALMTVALIPILGIMLGIFSRRMVKVNMSIKQNLGHFNAGIQNSISGMRVVKAFANEDFEKNIFTDLAERYRLTMVDFYNSMAISFSFNYIIMRLINLFALIAGSYYIIIGELTIGELVGYILLSNVFVRPLERINAMLEVYPKGYAGFMRLQEELSKQPDIIDSENAKEAPEFSGNIRYENVSFGYSQERPVLEKVNIDIKAGQTVAFVGPSGSGKTTLVNLLPRFYEISDGQINIDGIDIKDVTMQSLRKQIGIVQQDVFLFDGTIKENVLYGRLDATDEEVEAAINSAKLREVISNLPDGINTQIGERGVSLSGGQKQRLSIARIFLKNPKILILDEATSALDTATERFIQASLDELSQGRTSLVIAHRLATITNADRIIVVTPQGIMEDGTHDELLARNSVYADLYRSQFGKG